LGRAFIDSYRQTLGGNAGVTCDGVDQLPSGRRYRSWATPLYPAAFITRLRPVSQRSNSNMLHPSRVEFPLSYRLSSRSARRVFQRLGAPRRSSSKYLFPLHECCSDQRPSWRCLLRTGSEPGETANRALRRDAVRTGVRGQAGWRRETNHGSQRKGRTAMPPEGSHGDLNWT